MRYTMLFFILAVAIGILIYLGSMNSYEGFDTRNKSLMKGCEEPAGHSGNCGLPGKSGDIYMTKGIDEAKEQVWSVCPYECPNENLSDDVSICKYDKQCASVDVKTGKYNHACIVKLNINPDKVDRSQVKRFSSKKEMEKALGYKICSHKKPKTEEEYSREKTTRTSDMSDMIIDPRTEGQHQTPVKPGGGPGPHGSQLPNPGNPGPGMPSAHGGNPDMSCYPSPPNHHRANEPKMNTMSMAPGEHTLPHSPHAPFSHDGSFVAPHHHGKAMASTHHPEQTQYHCECK